MRARSSTFRNTTGAVDAGIALVRDEVVPAVSQLEGCVGVSMLVRRDSGLCIVTTAWESDDALRASEPHVAPLRERVQHVFGRPPEVQTWEIAVLHRRRPTDAGACARVTWMRLPPKQVDPQLDRFRSQVLPRIDELPGFCSASLLVDRVTGRSALAAVYESQEAMVGSRTAASGLRIDAAQQMSSDLLDVEEFEVALAHLSVPETV